MSKCVWRLELAMWWKPVTCTLTLVWCVRVYHHTYYLNPFIIYPPPPLALIYFDSQCDWTPLHWAAKRGHAEVCTVLVAAGAKVNAKDDVSVGLLVVGGGCGWCVYAGQ